MYRRLNRTANPREISLNKVEAGIRRSLSHARHYVMDDVERLFAGKQGIKIANPVLSGHPRLEIGALMQNVAMGMESGADQRITSCL
jgi:hypothetical protein